MIVIAVTGVIQAYIDVRSLHGLFHTTYGALIIAKIGAAARPDRPRLGQPPTSHPRAASAWSGDGRAPGGIGALARRTMRGEFALMIVRLRGHRRADQLRATDRRRLGALLGQHQLGPAELEMTVEPAQVGLNTIHLYLIDAKTGSQFTATKELTANAKLPAKGIGPLPLQADPRRTRPLHPQLGGAQPRRDMGNRLHRPRLGIRTVQPHGARCPIR